MRSEDKNNLSVPKGHGRALSSRDHKKHNKKIRSKVGDEEARMSSSANLSIPTYVIYRYPGCTLPKNYLNFVISKWSRSYRYGNDYIKLADSNAYFATYSAYIIRLLDQLSTNVRIACLADDTDVALGFSVTRGQILDYVHVHKDCRRHGIGTLLVPEDVKTFTHLTRTGMKLWSTKLPDAIFDPFA